MIGLYYKNIIADLKDKFMGQTVELSQELQNHCSTNSLSYGILKGKVVHVHLTEEHGSITAEIVQIRKGIAYEKPMKVLSSIDRNTLFEDLEAELSYMRNIILFFVVKDESFDDKIRNITIKMNIKRKKSIVYDETNNKPLTPKLNIEGVYA